MIPVFQLDPASLTLWIDPEMAVRAGPEAQETVAHAFTQDVDEVVAYVREVDDPALRARCALLASCCWHEQRHFLDFVLTNEGASRFRQYATIFVNARAAVARAKEIGEPLFCPVRYYAEPVLAQLHGLKDPSGDLGRIGRDIIRRSRLIVEDGRPIRSNGVSVSLGGEAIIEALAYLCQHHAILAHFGLEVSRDVQRDAAHGHGPATKYEWLVHLAETWGILPTSRDEDTVVYDVTLLMSIGLAALAVRRWNQDTIDDALGPSGSAAARLAVLMNGCRDRGIGARPVPAEDAWDLVNDIAREAWGRSVTEEIRADLELEEHHWARITKWAPDAVSAALAELHSLRVKVLNDLEDDPLPFVDLTSFVHRMLPSLRPMPVLARPSGQDSEVPEGYALVAGYRLQEPPRYWWWAVRPVTAPEPGMIALSDVEAWGQIVEWWAPLAKLMLNGRRHDVMLGPEIVSLEKRLETEGVHLRFAPRHEHPDESSAVMSAESFFNLVGDDEARCDVCHAEVSVADARLVSPWHVRADAQTYRRICEHMGDEATAQLMLLKDWSAWVMCAECAAPA